MPSPEVITTESNGSNPDNLTPARRLIKAARTGAVIGTATAASTGRVDLAAAAGGGAFLTDLLLRPRFATGTREGNNQEH